MRTTHAAVVLGALLAGGLGWLAIASLGTSGEPSGRTYYLSSAGDDAADGLSPGSAWRTIERANRGEYGPGDRILLEGGKTFEGTLRLTPGNARGTLQAPVLVSSYGKGRATLSGGGVAAVGVAGFSVERIDLAGGTDTSGAGISIVHDRPSTLSGLRVVDVEITGFTYAMLLVAEEPPARIEGIRLERVSAHGNAAGPSFFGHLAESGTVRGHYGIGNVYVGESTLFENTGWNQYNLGYGLVLMNAEDVTVERSRIHDNGGDNLPPGKAPNGPSAVTVYDGRNVVIQHNEISHQRRDPDGPTDNAGIDLWATDSLVQYNHVYGNEGWGMILGAGDPANPRDPHPWPSERNTVRYNVFLDNGRRLPRSRIPEQEAAQLILFGPVKDFEIYGNTLHSPDPGGATADVVEPEAMIGVSEAMISIYAVPPARAPEGIRFRNNVFVAGSRVRFVELPNLVVDARFESNAYIGGAGADQVTWGRGTTFDTIAAWSTETGQESVDGTFVARVVGPDALCAAGRAGAAAYRLRPGSPLIDAGADLPALGIEPGPSDYFGNRVPHPVRGDRRSGFDVGAHEWREDGAEPCP